MLQLRFGRRLRLFGLAFLLTLLVAGAALGLLWVDVCATQRGFAGISGSVTLRAESPLHYRLETRAGTRRIDLTPLDAFERARREVEIWTAPRPVRLAARWLTAGHLWLSARADHRRELEYRANAGLV
ncbi:MAG: hypothetical protein RR197_02240 [Oscillospiraceae bacterium]